MDKRKGLDIIKSYQKNPNNEALLELVERHSAICFSIYQRFASTLEALNYSTADFLDDKHYIIHSAALSYNPDKKSKFSTWLANQVRYHCLNLIHKKRRCILVNPAELREESIVSDNQEQNNRENFEFIVSILDKLKDKRIREIYMMRYFSPSREDTAWNRIAAKLSISAQTALNLHEKGKKMLRQKLESKTVCDVL